MRNIGENLSWPPGPLEELSALLRRSRLTTTRGEKKFDYSLVAALNEVDDWLTRPTGDKPSAGDFKSMVADVKEAYATRGPNLTRLTGTADQLVTQLGLDENSPAIASLTHQLRTELCRTEALEAAFDDLLASIDNADTSADVVDTHTKILTCLLRLADRSPEETYSMLAGILDDDALQVGYAQHDLDGTAIPDYGPGNASAGLSSDDRSTLCRRYLQHPTQAGHHVVWVVYRDARLSSPGWRIQLGPVEFFDGPTMLTVLKDASQQQLDDPLPEELLKPEAEGGISRDYVWPSPEDLQWWVAARIDLGVGRFSDAVRRGREQADTIVQLAIFRHRISSWEPSQGHIHCLDGLERSSSGPFSETGSDRRLPAQYDATDSQLERLEPVIARHLPLNNQILQRLLAVIQTINIGEASNQPDLVTQDVRVIEFFASQCGIPTWQAFLDSNFSYHRAYNEILHQVFAAVNSTMTDIAFRINNVIPNQDELQQQLTPSATPGQRAHNVARALELIPELAKQAPTYTAVGRRLRTVARHVETVDALNDWADGLIRQCRRDISLISRFRNSLSHGGQIQLDVALGARQLSSRAARSSAVVALEATMAGRPIKDEYDEIRLSFRKWKNNVAKAATVADALFPPEE